jgi:beta-glucosidase
LPAFVDGDALAREIAARSFVLVRNQDQALPLNRAKINRLALIGAAARDARVLGGGSAQVFPDHVVSPLDGLAAALPDGVLTYMVGADPNEELAAAGKGFELHAVCRDADGHVIGRSSLPSGQVNWMGDDLPEGVTYQTLRSVEIKGIFTPRESGAHHFGTRGLGGFRLSVDGQVLYESEQAPDTPSDPFEAFFGAAVERGQVELEAGRPVEVSLDYTVLVTEDARWMGVGFSLVHGNPQRDADELIAEAVEAARDAEVAVVVVATTERVESEGFDRKDLALPGRQDDLVHAVAAANPNTVVVVNAGSPVEMPWRDDVAAVLLTWFPGQEGGAALADVLLGTTEPGGRLPTTWPAALSGAPVTEITPLKGELHYSEGVFIGYRAWEQSGAVPAYPFGHGLGYTDWEYESVEVTGTKATIRVRNTGSRPGRETVQLYVAPVDDTVERPARWLAGFATVAAAPGETVQAVVELPRRTFEIWDEQTSAWSLIQGTYEVQASRSLTDTRLTARLEV